VATAKAAAKTKVVSKGGAKEFADLVDSDPKVRAQVKKAAAGILDVAKKHGFHFKGEELQEHLHKRLKVPKSKSTQPDGDGPMTCFCFSETPGF
jgi:predicted ribosomally synthesized peptide with nif11-like leader